MRESVAPGAAERKPEQALRRPGIPPGMPTSARETRYVSDNLNWRFMVSAPAPRVYKGFTLQARTFQVRGSGLWTLDVTIGRRGSLRAFSSAETFSNEHDATVACWRMACRIIDKSPPDCRVADLSVD